MELIRGGTYVVGDNINTDIISPPRYMELSIEEASIHSMEAIDENFAKNFKQGTILVAGNNLGSGSSRETSPLTLKYLGTKAIVAVSFARIFYRNCINLGIPTIICPQAKEIKAGDEIGIDFEEGVLINLSQKTSYSCSRLPEHIQKMLDAGGLIEYLKLDSPTSSKFQ
ncbi:3-isopropylmalate dehydratase [Enterococcus sp. DIV0756]|uniref:LeuD/DmdB family oxidoreductase small subunit n=1 Tax=Enterococcus sp. DIV0756 TaxID=2774636 RepID=UPI003F215D55